MIRLEADAREDARLCRAARSHARASQGAAARRPLQRDDGRAGERPVARCRRAVASPARPWSSTGDISSAGSARRGWRTPRPERRLRYLRSPKSVRPSAAEWPCVRSWPAATPPSRPSPLWAPPSSPGRGLTSPGGSRPEGRAWFSSLSAEPSPVRIETRIVEGLPAASRCSSASA